MKIRVLWTPTRLERARILAHAAGKYRVLAHQGMWYVITPRGHARPCVSWELAMGSMPGKKVAA